MMLVQPRTDRFWNGAFYAQVRNALFRACGHACVMLAMGIVLAGAVFSVSASAQDKPKAVPAQSEETARINALTKRVAQLEEQVVDLQVAIGTLESLAQPAPSQSVRTFSTGRAATSQSEKALQAQVRALSAQVESLRAEVRALQAGGATSGLAFQNSGAATQQPLSPEPQAPAFEDGFGATVVSPAPPAQEPASDSIGSLIEQQELQPLPSAPQRQDVATPSIESRQQLPPIATPAPGGGDARAVYEASYNLLLQQDFDGAQKGFRTFLREFPKDKLVPNALYWLGETYYVQENYTDAAEAFDIVTAAYSASNKAPDSQLKRGMALANLGKRREACSVLGALAQRFPNAPDYVKTKAASERDRVGCRS